MKKTPGMNNTLIVTVAAATLGALASWQPAARAETLVIDGKVVVAKSDLPRPTGGMTMAKVEARFGSPRDRHPTVGKPPITRWDYEHFSVFFEKDRVIDAVVFNSAPNPAAPAVATAAGAASAAAAADTGASDTPDTSGRSDTSSRPGDSSAPSSAAPHDSGGSSLINIAGGAAAADATAPVPAQMPKAPPAAAASPSVLPPASAQSPASAAGTDQATDPTSRSAPAD